MSLIDYFAIHIVPRMYRGKGALHPAETGQLTDMVSCVREYDVDVFFIRKGETLIAIDAGYKDHPALLPGCREIGVDPADVTALFLTHADPDHAGGLDIHQENHFRNAEVYLGETEENYLTNTYHRKQIGPFGLKNSVTIRDGYHLLKDGETVEIGGIKLQAFLVPGHTLGHLCYLVDDCMLFTGDSIALNKDGGWCFFDIFNYDSKMNKASLAKFRNRIDLSAIKYVFTSHNGFTDDAMSAFLHTETIPDLKAKGFIFDETAPYDCFAMSTERGTGKSPEPDTERTANKNQEPDHEREAEKSLEPGAKQKSRDYFNSHRKSRLARAGYWRPDYRYQLEAIGRINPDRLIDIGCGPGAFLSMVEKRFPEIQLNALDLSEEMISETRERLAGTAIATVGDAENMPLESEQYQVVTCNMSIHHYPHPKEALSEMYRILRPGGTLLLNDMDCVAPVRAAANMIFPRLPGGDVKMYKREEIERMVRGAGFCKVRYRKISPFSFQCIAEKTR